MRIYLTLLSVVSSSMLMAATATWNIDGNASWNDNGNWTPATFPNAVDDVAQFLNIITANRTVSLGQNITVGSIEIDDGNNYRIAGSDTLTFDVTAGNATLTISNANGNGSHRISCPISLADTLNLTQGSTGVFEIDGVVSGSGGLIKNGSGTLLVDVQDNTYTGTTIINAGTFDYAERGAIPSGGNVIINGGTLIINRSMSGANALNVVVNAGGMLQQGNNDIVRLANVSGTGTLRINPVDLQLFEIFGSGGDSTFDGMIILGAQQNSNDPNGGSRFIKSGNTTLTLTNANTYACRTFVRNGSQINLENSSALGLSTAGGGSRAFTESGGTFGLSVGGLNVNKDFALNGSGVSGTGAIRNLVGSNEISGEVEIGWSGGSVIASDVALQVDSGTSLNLSNVLKGSNQLTKVGNGSLTFSGSSNNTHSGLLRVDAGTVFLNKTAATAVEGPILVNPTGTVSLSQANQISTNSVMTLSGGTFMMNGLEETINALIFNSGTLSQGGASLSLESTSTALTMRDTTTSDEVRLTGGSGGEVRFDASNNGTATIHYIDFGTVNRMFTVESGTSSVDMEVIHSQGTNAGFLKEGPGALLFSGTHSHSGAISSVNAGEFILTGDLTGDLNVGPVGTLTGTGTITGATDMSGILNTGGSIGTLFVVGDFSFSPGSTYFVEVNPTMSDLTSVTGNVSIGNNTTLSITPDPGTYSSDTFYTIITATGSVTGQFTTVTHSFPLLIPIVIYNPQSVVIDLQIASFTDVVTKGNPSKVAACLDGTEPAPGSDLAGVYNDLLFLTTPQLIDALDQMQPSMLKGLILAQENNTFRMREHINQRLSLLAKKACDVTRPGLYQVNLWADVSGDYQQQGEVDQNPAFRSSSTDVVLGIDCAAFPNIYIGASGAYSHSNVWWKQNRGDGDINSGYLSLYGGFLWNQFNADLILTGGYNRYDETRRINFPGVHRKASSDFNGGEFLGHLDLGMTAEWKQTEFRPFVSVDYLYLYQNHFSESGASSLNLSVEESHYGMTRVEIGSFFRRCIQALSLDIKLSYIREDRYQGAHYRAKLQGTDCNFSVKGMNPHRNLFSPGLALSYFSPDQKCVITLATDGEIGRRYWDQYVSLQGVLRF